ncbi:MAG: hypothetical protein CEO19_358 [Parcubacteria group bacterium Gr01-1014_73]|nr:MAG: hypothetical protein CEO19_358 [Parcubacteria group bacterium Gr01-1014_73]
MIKNMAKSFENLNPVPQDEVKFPRKRIEREIAGELGFPDLNKIASREDDLITGGNAIILSGGMRFDSAQHRWVSGTNENGQSAYEIGRRELEEIRIKYGEKLLLFRLKSLLRCHEAKLFWPYERYGAEVYQSAVIEKFANDLNEEERKELLGFIQESLATPLAELREMKNISVAAATEVASDDEPYGLLKAEYTQKHIDGCEHHLECLQALLPVLPAAVREANQQLVEELRKFLDWIIENRPEPKSKI